MLRIVRGFGDALQFVLHPIIHVSDICQIECG
jgi:hypothetical protein